MWIKVKKFPGERPAVCIGGNIFSNDLNRRRIHFAKRSLDVDIIMLPREENGGDTFANPAILHCSAAVLERLLLPEGYTFQLQEQRGGEIRIGPVIAFMLGEQQYYYNNQLMSEFTDQLGAYPEIGGLVYGFKCSSIDWDKEQIYGLAYNYQAGKWEYGIFPFPAAIYRRTFLHGEEEAAFFAKNYGIEVFNPRKFDKFEMHSLLEGEPELAGYLPDTAMLEMETLKKFLAKHKKVILKPIDLSRGRGIMVIEETGDGFRIAVNHEDKSQVPWVQEIPRYLLKEFLEKDSFFTKRYIIQQYLQLSKINGSSWDIRVVMQKDAKKRWSCHGIEIRLANPNHFVTNISTGGRALSVNTALKLMYGPKQSVRKFKETLIGVCRKFCFAMDRINSAYAEFGLDLCLDTSGRIWFIEANTRPSFNGFKTLSQKNYLKICETPILYAAALQGMGRNRKMSNQKNENKGKEKLPQA